MSQIRLRFSGLVVFTSRIISLLTGLGLAIIVTRRLPIADFGVWQLISVVIAITTIPSHVVNFWVVRYEARGLRAAKTGLMLNGFFILIGLAGYFALSFPVSWSVQSPYFFFALASIQVPLYYFVNNLDAISYGARPQAQGYAFIIFEVSKIAFAFLLVDRFKLSLSGAIIAVALAQVLQVSTLYHWMRGRISGRFDRPTAMIWLSSAWLPIFWGGISFLYAADSLVVSSITRSSVPVAIYRAAFLLGDIVGYSSLLAIALYPRLLSGGRTEDIETALRYVLMLAVPMTVGIFTMARPLLYLLRPEYAAGELTLRILVFASLAICISRVLDLIIMGVETVDITEKPSFRRYVKSGLFLAPSINFLNAVTHLAALGIVVYLSVRSDYSYEQITVVWAAVFLAATVPFTCYKLTAAKKRVKFRFPPVSLIKYVVGSLAMHGFLVFTVTQLRYDVVFAIFLGQVLLLVAAGSTIYFAFLYVFDSEFRDMLRTLKSTLMKEEKTSFLKWFI